MGDTRGSCQLIDLSTGAVLWELDLPGAYIYKVYPYENKVVIVWFPPMGEEDKSRVSCVEVPSGEIIWENREPRYYQKYGNDKLVFFYSSLWEDGYEHGDNHQLAELDIRTGAFQMYKFPGINQYLCNDGLQGLSFLWNTELLLLRWGYRLTYARDASRG